MKRQITEDQFEKVRIHMRDTYDVAEHEWDEEELIEAIYELLVSKNESLHLVSGCLPDESELAEAVDTAIYKSDCSTKPWIKEFKEQLKLSGYKIIESNNR